MNEQRRRDHALAQRCASGCRAAWSAIIEDSRPHLRFTVLQTLQRYNARRSDAQVEDLVAKIQLRIAEDDFRRLRSYSGRSTLKTWLRTLAVNTTIDFLRKKREILTIDDEELGSPEPIDHASPEDAAMHRQLLEQLARLTHQLNDDDRLFLTLHFVEQRSFAEIAERMNKSPASLYARKHRLTERLRGLAAEHGLAEDFRWDETG